MKNKNAFLTIEVLISMVIVFLAILTLTSSIKSDILFTKKIHFYEKIYITTLSAQNMIKHSKFESSKITKDFHPLKIRKNKINGFTIKAKVKKIKELRNYVDNFFDAKLSKNNGSNIFILYKVKLEISEENFQKEFEFFVTKIVKKRT